MRQYKLINKFGLSYYSRFQPTSEFSQLLQVHHASYHLHLLSHSHHPHHHPLCHLHPPSPKLHHLYMFRWDCFLEKNFFIMFSFKNTKQYSFNKPAGMLLILLLDYSWLLWVGILLDLVCINKTEGEATGWILGNKAFKVKGQIM